MTKLRTPDSLEDAVKQASALLGNEAIAIALNAINLKCSGSLIDKWADGDAVQVPSFPQVMAMENLLIKTGHAPIFVDLLTRLQPVEAAPETAPDPLREALRACGTAADLMKQVDRSMVDGVIDRREVTQIDRSTQVVQRQLARFRRVLRAALDKPRRK